MKNNKTTKQEENVSRETELTEDEKFRKAGEEAHKTLEKQKKERAESATYAIKSFKQLVTKLERMKMTTPDETEKMKEICKTVIQRWISVGIEF